MHVVNHKKLFRPYREEKLAVRRRSGRKRALGMRAPLVKPVVPNECWALDFMSDQLTDGRRFWILTAVDICTLQCIRLITDTSRVHQQHDRRLGGGAAYRMALYRAWEAHVEWVPRERQ